MCPVGWRWAARLGAVALLAAGSEAAAMLFSVESVGGSRVLVAYDCGRFGNRPCNDNARHETMVHGPVGMYPGDAAMLDRHLSRERFDEVLLISGGGDLREGLRIGEVLRRHQATVRVPRGAACVSACTVAFLGGLFRTVDDGATYQVHAYSRFLRGVPDRMRAELVADPERALEAFARAEYADAREWAVRLMTYFQRMIHGAPAGGRAEAVLRAARREVPPYIASGELRSHVARLVAEGDAAAHEIVMAIERASMAAAIEDLRSQVGELGTRAAPALRMLETMFTSRILGTATLSRETLLQLGFVTPVVATRMEPR